MEWNNKIEKSTKKQGYKECYRKHYESVIRMPTKIMTFGSYFFFCRWSQDEKQE